MRTQTRSLITIIMGLLIASGAAAQDHSQHQMPAQDRSGQAVPGEDVEEDQDHSAHKHHAPPADEESKPQVEEADHAAMGHDMPTEPAAQDHAVMGHMPAPTQPRTSIPPLSEADRLAARPPPADHPVHDNTVQQYVLVDRLEGFDGDEGNGQSWEAQAWIGTDLDRLWLRSEGERTGGHTQAADLELLYGRAISPWWDLVAGVRHDFKPGASQDFLAFGVRGSAPYKFEVEATAYLGQSGQSALRLEVEYDTLLTNRLILQPLVGLDAYGKDDAKRGIGSGLNSAEAGLRLRYEITRQFAPYVGVEREWTFGRAADLRREAGEAAHDTRFVAGIRLWF
jgi:copper resistance protein B